MADIQVSLWECITFPLRIARLVNVCPVQHECTKAVGVTGRITSNPEVIGSSVGLVATNALVCMDEPTRPFLMVLE